MLRSKNLSSQVLHKNIELPLKLQTAVPSFEARSSVAARGDGLNMLTTFLLAETLTSLRP